MHRESANIKNLEDSKMSFTIIKYVRMVTLSNMEFKFFCLKMKGEAAKCYEPMGQLQYQGTTCTKICPQENKKKPWHLITSFNPSTTCSLTHLN